jgi:hypothetical protein
MIFHFSMTSPALTVTEQDQTRETNDQSSTVTLKDVKQSHAKSTEYLQVEIEHLQSHGS